MTDIHIDSLAETITCMDYDGEEGPLGKLVSILGGEPFTLTQEEAAHVGLGSYCFIPYTLTGNGEWKRPNDFSGALTYRSGKWELLNK